MAGFENDIVFAKNADFTQADNQAPTEANGLATNGQLWVGTTATNAGGTHINVGTITSPDASVIVGYSSPNITLTAVGVSPTTFDGDTGTATPAMNVIILAGGTGITTSAAGNTVTFDVDGAVVAQTITGDSGGALSPTAGNWNLLGSGSITTVGSGSTLTTQLTGLTNHAVLVGAGTSTITKVGPTATAGQVLQSAGAAADPAFSTATYPSTTTVSQILYSSATNVVSGLATANSASLVTTSAGVPVWSSTMTNGQVIIGSTGATPTAASLTAGTGITITPGAGSITIAANGSVVGQTLTADTGGALSPTAGNFNIFGGPGITTSGSGSTITINGPSFTDTTATTLASDNGYFATAAGTYTLPPSPSQGELIMIAADTTGAVAVTANTGQIIRLGNQVTSTAGSLTSTARGDALILRYRSSGAVWIAFSSIGNWTYV